MIWAILRDKARITVSYDQSLLVVHGSFLNVEMFNNLQTKKNLQTKRSYRVQVVPYKYI